MNSSKKGFTLIELLVVFGMIALIMGALTTGVKAAQERARKQKALSDVKAVSQAILAYENYAVAKNEKLPTCKNREADASSLGFLIGQGGNAESGGKIPALLMASLQAGGVMRDPWGKPYLVSIQESDESVKIMSASGSMQTGYSLPNLYRLTVEERK